ncbi:MAG: DNA polymerase sliding clamp, partial [Halobacteriaceae archaeon]
ERRVLQLESDGLSFNLSIIDPDTVGEEPEMVDLSLPTDVTIPAEVFDEIIKACSLASDHITIGSDPGENVVYAVAEGDTDGVRYTLQEDAFSDGTVGEARSLYNLDYLYDMSKAIPNGTGVELQVGQEYPLIISYTLADGQTVTFVLAPRIQED